MAPTPEDLTPGAYRSLGLISNPFRSDKPARDTDYPGVELVSHAAANALLVALDAAANDPESRPIWVEKAGDFPLSYYVRPLARVLQATGSEAPELNVLTTYVPLDMMRIGRVRAVLSVVAERISGVDVDLTIAAWMRRMLGDLDTALPEYAALAESDLEALDAALAAEPVATIERFFGPAVSERKGAEDLEVLMRVSTARQDALEADPDESSTEASVDGEAPSDPMSEVFATPPVVVDISETATDVDAEAAVEAVPEPEPEPDDGLPRADDLVAYVAAYTAAHLSPVVARAFRAYRAQGISSMTQELKVTKAPTKTLAALCRLATCRFRKVEILVDRFDIWPSVPEDLRMKIIGTLSQLRFALRDGAVLAILSATGQTPEVEEQFATATRVLWDMKGLAAVEGMEPEFDAETAQHWLDSATLAGHGRIVLTEGPFARLLPSADVALAPAVDLLAAAIDEAAMRGLEAVDDAAVDAVLTAAAETLD